MNLLELLREIRETLLRAVDQVRTVEERIEGREPPRRPDPDEIPGQVPPSDRPPIYAPAPPRPPAEPPPPATPQPGPGDVAGEPDFRVHYVDPLVWRVLELEAPKAGLRAVTIAAIQVWESNWYTSKLFRAANNVGGVKYRPDLARLKHIGKPYTATDSNVYASWPTWQEGIAGQVLFLTQTRYDGVRQTDDALAEVRAIHEAGYAEHSQEWLDGISALVRRFQAEGHA